MSTTELNAADSYRLPWSMTDNGISWLEITNKCNLACEGCYRDPRGGGHKTLKEVAEDLAVFKRLRKSDCMSVAGGDPLVHPQIVEITRMIKAGGWKPVINTNGLALTPPLLKDLKKAGVFGFTFHIDTSQKRPDSPGETEQDHNRLRQTFAEMLDAEGGIACSFNQTVNTDTLEHVPEVVRWARDYPRIVHSIVFILYRQPFMLGEFDYYVNGDRIRLDAYEDRRWGGSRPLKTDEIVRKIREVEPGFTPCAYLNGTEDPDSFKWSLAVRAAIGGETIGYMPPRYMEAVQFGSHLLRRRWLSYCSPRFLTNGQYSLFALAPFDTRARRLARHYLGRTVRNPALMFRKVYMQTFAIIQPIDVLPDGRMNMCDSCPDITVHEGKLYWSCRLEEIKRYGSYIRAVPRTAEPVHQ